MLFESIDQKNHCKSIVLNNEIKSEYDINDLTGTWAYHNAFRDLKHIRYASLYANGKNLNDCCPAHLKQEWEEVKKEHFAYINSFKNGLVNQNDYCFYDLVPVSFVKKYFSTKNKITEWILNNYSKPNNYDFLVSLSALVQDIKSRKVKINTNNYNWNFAVNTHSDRAALKKIKRSTDRIEYNVFGTITGRLTTKKNSFPILTMKKEHRTVIEPHNDYFIELDFNAAELRCLLSLNEEIQPEKDIHLWHGEILNNVLDHNLTREEIKQKIFGWLYGSGSASLGFPKIEKFYNKQKALDKYWDGEKIVNPFGREIEADKFHALNALIQSTASDVFLRRAIEVNNALRTKKSFTTALIHDSMVIDFSKEDKGCLEQIIEVFSDTDIGKFKTNVSVGTNFGNMKRFK